MNRITFDALKTLRLSNLVAQENAVLAFVYPSRNAFEAYGPDAHTFAGTLPSTALAWPNGETSSLYEATPEIGHARALVLCESRKVVVLNGDDLVSAMESESE